MLGGDPGESGADVGSDPLGKLVNPAGTPESAAGMLGAGAGNFGADVGSEPPAGAPEKNSFASREISAVSNGSSFTPA
jgi:hypothetical protein